MATTIDGHGNMTTHYNPRAEEDSYARPTPPKNPDGPHVFNSVAEQARTYTFPHGKVTITEVVGINVSKSGTHRINTKDGKKHIVPPGWIHIEFDAPHWSF